MSNKEKILDLYYNQHLKQNKIAEIVGTTTQYVSKVVRADKRNKQEKEKRKNENSENRKVYLREYFKIYDRPKKDDNSYEQMIAQQRQDSMELSYNSNNISDPDLVNINQLKEMLGIGITLAYRLVRNKTIKALKVGRQYKIPKRNVIAYLTNQNEI